MNNAMDPIARDRELLAEARGKGRGAMLRAFVRLSGPGWLQSAITLGGGSLASSLYLGVLAGASLLWLQPFAMILGVIMLSAIGYVTLSTGERPFGAINRHVNPVLGWGWIIATMMANLVWSMPQFSLGVGALRQNLFPVLDRPEVIQPNLSMALCSGCILMVCLLVTLFYDRGSRGVKLFEAILKMMVGVIVLCFFGVVVRMSWEGVIDWRAIFSGLVPDLRMLSQPARTFAPYLAEMDESARAFWSGMIVSQQRDVMISAAATAVGINMTFLLPYSMLRKGWDRNFRGLAIFDLSTGLFVPFVLATGMVVIASASQFHTKAQPGLVEPLPGVTVKGNLVADYNKLLSARIASQLGAGAPAEAAAAARQALPRQEKTMAAMLVKRDAFNLADALTPLIGSEFAQYVFGVGVVAMVVSSIIMLMMINGFVLCEMLNVPSRGKWFRIGAVMPGIGVIAPFVWGTQRAQFWLAIPASVFAMTLIFIAYWTFFFMMNSRTLLGEDRPTGARRLRWNLLMLIAAGAASAGSFWVIWSKARWIGVLVLAAFLGLTLIAHLVRQAKRARSERA